MARATLLLSFIGIGILGPSVASARKSELPPLGMNGCLPQGVHRTSFAELEERFATNEWRDRMTRDLRKVLLNLRKARVRNVWVAGSFVTTKWQPGDVDLVYRLGKTRVNRKLLTNTLRGAGPRGIHLYDADVRLGEMEVRNPRQLESFFQFFSYDRAGRPRGLVKIRLGTL
jgi:hypothetical protein